MTDSKPIELNIDTMIDEAVDILIEDEIAEHNMCRWFSLEVSIRFIEALVKRLNTDLATMREKQRTAG